MAVVTGRLPNRDLASRRPAIRKLNMREKALIGRPRAGGFLTETRSAGSRVCRLPPEGGSDLAGDRLEHASVVFNSQLVRHRQQQRVGRLDGFVSCELLCNYVGFACIGASEAGEGSIEVTDLVPVPGAAAAEIQPVLVAENWYHAAADGDPRLATPAGIAPRPAKYPDLLRLQLIERDAGVLGQER